jgi:hypothetical protein
MLFTRRRPHYVERCGELSHQDERLLVRVERYLKITSLSYKMGGIEESPPKPTLVRRRIRPIKEP